MGELRGQNDPSVGDDEATFSFLVQILERRLDQAPLVQILFRNSPHYFWAPLGDTMPGEDNLVCGSMAIILAGNQSTSPLVIPPKNEEANAFLRRCRNLAERCRFPTVSHENVQAVAAEAGTLALAAVCQLVPRQNPQHEISFLAVPDCFIALSSDPDTSKEAVEFAAGLAATLFLEHTR